MCISSGKLTFPLKFKQDLFSVLQLIAEPRAIIFKGRICLWSLSYTAQFFLSEVATWAEVGSTAWYMAHCQGQPYFHLFCPSYCDPAHIFNPWRRLYNVPEVKTTLSPFSTNPVSCNVWACFINEVRWCSISFKLQCRFGPRLLYWQNSWWIPDH